MSKVFVSVKGKLSVLLEFSVPAKMRYNNRK